VLKNGIEPGMVVNGETNFLKEKNLNKSTPHFETRTRVSKCGRNLGYFLYSRIFSKIFEHF